MDTAATPLSNTEQLELAFKDYSKLNQAAVVAWGIGLLMVLSGFLIPYSNGIFSSFVIAPIYLVGAAPTIYFWRQSRLMVATTDPAEKLQRYDKLRSNQSAATVLVTVGAVAMIPGAIILIQMMPVGWAIMLNLYAGAIIGFRINSVNRRIQYYRSELSDVAESEVNVYKSPRITLPPDVKRPIGQVLVWIGGIVILAINLIMELTTYSAIRNFGMQDGLLLDLSSQMLFALSQIFDVIVLSVFGIILLILALINQARVLDKRKNLIAIAIVVAGLVIFPGGISSVLAGAAGPSDSLVQTQTEGKESTETIRAIMNSGPVPGFEGVYEEFYDCNDGGCSDSLMRLANEVGPSSMAAEYCAGIVEFGSAIGMTGWGVAPEYVMEPIDGDLNPAIDACTKQVDQIEVAEVQQYQAYSEAFVMEGTSTVGAMAPIRFVFSQAIDGNLDDNPGFHTYFIEITTTFQTEPYQQIGGGLSQGLIEVNDLLDLIGQKRLANPDRAPMDRAFTEEILAEYPHQIEMTLVENSSGEIHRIHLTNSDGAEMCLSIEPWGSDPFNEGMPDPGMGYGLGYLESLDVLRGFGLAVEGNCG